MSYSQTDLARMRDCLPELREKFAKNPNSLVLRNGIAHIEKILGLEQTVSKIDPLQFPVNKTKQGELRKNC